MGAWGWKRLGSPGTGSGMQEEPSHNDLCHLPRPDGGPVCSFGTGELCKPGLKGGTTSQTPEASGPWHWVAEWAGSIGNQ